MDWGCSDSGLAAQTSRCPAGCRWVWGNVHAWDEGHGERFAGYCSCCGVMLDSGCAEVMCSDEELVHRLLIVVQTGIVI